MVVWIADQPLFETPEGISKLDEVCMCKMPSNDDELHEMVSKCQVHQHIATCKKNNTTSSCRFNFLRQECDESKIVDEFIVMVGGYALKHGSGDIWINNYNRMLLKLWKCNMDI